MTTDLALPDLLDLVGKLDDAPGEDTPARRFRKHLQTRIDDVGTFRDYIETCIRTPGPQFNRALQDLVNRLGEMLGFTVTYGRYAGKQGEIGFDGHWVSPRGAHIVVEVKTTDTYSIKTATLLNYMNELVSQGQIDQQARRLGLYVVGRPDAELAQLENAITAEKRLQELRIASVDSVLSLVELRSSYDTPHEAILGLLLPSGPRIDPIVDLMAGLVAQERGREPARATALPIEPVPSDSPGILQPEEETRYYLSPIQWKGLASPMEAVGKLLSASKYAFGERTPCRKHIKPGDRICFYASGLGVFAHATIATAPKHEPLPKLTRDPESYPWTFSLADVVIYEDDPIPMSTDVRKQLSAFEEADLGKNWGWFVTATKELTANDFRVLTSESAE